MHILAHKAITALCERLKDRFNILVKLGFEIEFYIHSHAINDEDMLLQLKNKVVGNLEFACERGYNQFEAKFKPSFELTDWNSSIEKFRLNLASQFLNHKILFNPKPFLNDFGSALHINVSIHDLNQNNIFQNTSDSEVTFQKIIFGALDLLNESLYFTSSEENFNRFDYKFLAPTHVSWGGNNRTHAIRVPTHISTDKRFELRTSGADCNIDKLIVYTLISILHGLNDCSLYYPKIYGNAFDKQYGCEKLVDSKINAHQIFKTKGKFKNYLKEFIEV